MKLMMRRKNVLRLSFLIVLLALLWSCRNEDFAQAEKNPQRNNQDFFKHSKNNDAFARAGVDYIDILDAYNKEKDFLSQMPDQKGMPIWEKMQVVDADGATGLTIPLSHDDETMSSILFATLDGKNEVTGVKDYDNALLQNIVYDEKISKENRENLFLTFMQMDNRTFGNEHFIGIPKDLFVGKKSDDEYGIMWVRNFALSSAATTDETGKLMIIESCFIALHCTHHGGGNICDAEDGCTECGTTFCTYEVIGTADDPFPSTPGGGGGGGGGGCSDCGGGGGTTPGPNVPTNPCGSNLGTVFYRLAPGCGGGNTDIPDLDDPCEKTKTLLAKPDVKAKIDLLEEQSKKSGDDRGEKAFLYMNDNTPSAIIGGEDHEVNLTPYSGYKGVYHNHTPVGTKMLAPYDIRTLYRTIVYQQNSATAKDTFVGMVAYETCNCPPDNFVYHNYLIRFNGDFSTTGAVANLSVEEMEKQRDYNYKLEMKLLSIPSLRNGPGLTSNLNSQGLEQLFFGTLAKMNIDPNQIILQKIEKDGTIYNINLNPDGSTTPVPCL